VAQVTPDEREYELGLLGSVRNRSVRPARVLLGLVAFLAVVLVAASIVVFWPSTPQTSVTAYFQRATGLYAGSEVRILGVKVGSVSSVVPDGAQVRVKFHWESKQKVPANAQAVIIVSSLVADRYVQLAPVYTGGPAMHDGQVLPLSQTVVPVELDDANAAINNLATALGPNGANSQGAVSKLLSTSAQTLSGQGANFKKTLQDLAGVSSILAQNSGNTTDTVTNLAKITQTMADSDSSIRNFEQNLATVSGQLSNERYELRAALSSLTVALADVSTFIRNNKDEVSANVQGLAQITGILVKEKAGLQEFLDKAPLAAENAMAVYDPQDGSLHSRMNLEYTRNTAMWLCSLAYSLGAPPKQCEALLKPLNALGDPLSKISLDLPGLYGTQNVIPPPPDAYANGQVPQSAQVPDPSFGGIIPPTGKAKK
jgi:virulence factor Mce-like protein